ncbi:rhomboid family intramembrane serine protease [candidate division KSB1 bacterium]|nr:rhomboid family intramembrane serine protease [candidate division KSB1 bacterium]
MQDNYSFERPQYQFGFGNGITKAVKFLLAANGIMFFVQQVFPNFTLNWLGLFPQDVTSHFYVWQLGTYMFLHGGFIHILLNMFILWMFGCEIERYMGEREFIRYYLICGVGGGLVHVLIQPSSMTPVVGASGAIYGLLAAFAMLFPDRRIMLFPFFISLKAKHWVLIFLGITLLFGFTGRQDGVAHFAHLGGMLVGFAYFKFKLGGKIHIGTDFFKKQYKERKMMSLAKKRRHTQQLREEVDAILDKINENGYDALTEHEKQTLKQASDLFSKE